MTVDDDIATAWAQAGEPPGYKVALGRVAAHLAPNEHVQALAPGRVQDTTGVLTLTDERVLFVTRSPATTLDAGFTFTEIINAESTADGMHSEITLATQAQELVIDQMSEDDAAQLAALISDEVTAPLPVSPAPPVRRPAAVRAAAVPARPAPVVTRPPTSYATTPTAVGPAPKKKRRTFMYVILAINTLFLIWVIIGASGSNSTKDCGSLSADACNSAQNVGKGIGVVIVILLWAVVDVILGVIYLVTRKREPQVIYMQQPPS